MSNPYAYPVVPGLPGRYRPTPTRTQVARARRVLTVLALAVILAGLIATIVPAAARADTRPTTLDRDARTVQTTAPTIVQTAPGIDATRRLPGGRLAVHFTDGTSYDVRPCRYEDGHACWWDAGTRGNGVGTSFVALRGALHFLPNRAV